MPDEPLGEYRGHPIIKTSIAITNAGDGLSKAMKIAPRILEPGDRVMVLLEAEVDEHGIKFIEDTEAFELKQRLRAETATIVEGQNYERLLRKVGDKIAKAEAEEKGQARMDGMDAEDLEPGAAGPDLHAVADDEDDPDRSE